MTPQPEADPPPSDNQPRASKDEAFWMIIALRLLQGFVILALWYFGPAIIKLLGF
jgi:hypothetical protein